MSEKVADFLPSKIIHNLIYKQKIKWVAEFESNLLNPTAENTNVTATPD
jgi:hypothetical protein